MQDNQTPLQVLERYWGYKHFRPIQEDIINAVLEGEDVLAILPTGGGKSLCFQLPALMRPGLCLVVSPLIALMEDQVRQLRHKRIAAATLHSGLSSNRFAEIMQYARQGGFQFLYVAPERLGAKGFREFLYGVKINYVAIDEAHCISQWGLDFRPSYREIADLKKEFPNLQYVAFTASASPRVQQDITASLRLTRPRTFRGGTSRPNLSYQVAHVGNKIQALRAHVTEQPGVCIVYAHSRAACEQLSYHLSHQGLKAEYYHAGMTTQRRTKTLSRFLAGKIPVIIATSAFGMGIDKADIRKVIHWDLPLSLEEYYQEAGRAGRDGKYAEAIALLDGNTIPRMLDHYKQQYPPLVSIHKVWNRLHHYADNKGTDQYGNINGFDLSEFAEWSQRSFVAVKSILEHLHRYQWIRFLPKGYSRSEFKMLMHKEQLYEYTDTMPAMSPLISHLLRGYEGLFFRYNVIHENKLAQAIEEPELELLRQLKILHQHGVIDYRRSSSNQSVTLLPRPQIDEDTFSDYLELQQVRYQQLHKFIQYIETDSCRSQQIQMYFGDHDHQPCGICDNCQADGLPPEQLLWYRERDTFLLSDWMRAAGTLYASRVKAFLARELEAGRIVIHHDRVTKSSHD